MKYHLVSFPLFVFLIPGLAPSQADLAPVVFEAVAPPSVVAPSPDGAANVAQPVVRWTPTTNAIAYDMRLYADANLALLLEQQRIVGKLETVLATTLTNGQLYYLQITADLGTALSTGPVSRFRVFLMPSWMPSVRIETHDPSRSIPGYRLINLLPPFGGVRAAAMLVVNEFGEILWYYRSPYPGALLAPHVLPDGHVLFAEQVDGPNQVVGLGFKIQWDWTMVWRSLGDRMLHHDIGLGPDGNYMALNWIWKQHNGQLLEGDGVVIMDPNDGSVLWEWDIFDHFDPDLWPTPEMNSRGISGRDAGDWTHANAVEWDPARSIIWVSVRHFDNLVGIDYPSGNVRVIVGRGGLGGAGLMSHQHAPEVQADGTILLFDNGLTYATPLSRVTVIDFDEQAGTAQIVWEWSDGFFDPIVGDADRLPNGNVLVTAGASRRVMEVTPGGDIVWELQADWLMYRAEYVPVEQFPIWLLRGK